MEAIQPPFAGDVALDCYYHNAVPSVAVCRDCLRTICATCRDNVGLCPGCRLEQRLKAAQSAHPELGGTVGPSSPPPQPPPNPQPAPPAAQRQTVGTLAQVSPETRALLALGYPLWPLAAIALLDPKRSPDVRRQASQAIGFNFGCYALWLALGVVSHIPLLGWSAFPLFALVIPIWFVASVIYGIRVWHGDEVRVPLISDWLDERQAHVA
jgi:hypothetical protein